jgi:carbamoyltransferase
MYTLGINSGLNASVVLLRDGEVSFGVQEERLCRVKNQPGFPSLSLHAALEKLAISVDELDKVCIGGKSSRIIQTRADDLEKYRERYEQITNRWFSKRAIRPSQISQKAADLISRKQPPKRPKLEFYLEKYGLVDRVERYDHHTCHAAAAYYGLGSPNRSQYLILTMDGGGDQKTSAIFVGENGHLTEIACSLSMSLASLYAHITFILGFLPHEHEYKLMGLAPYAGRQYAEEVKEKLYAFIGFSSENPLELTNTDRFPNLDGGRGPDKLKWIDKLYQMTLGYRFDTLAAGLQLFVEEMSESWVRNAIEQTGISNVLLSGGFFMNVKVNQLIAEMSEVETVNCFPSCGDETNAFGAAFLGYHGQAKSTRKQPPISFSNFCIGPAGGQDLQAGLEKFSQKIKAEKQSCPNQKIAELLASGKIIARCAGAMEFGARALGSRSILAAPNDLKNVRKINQAIKKRDFWMPFAPAVLIEEAHKLLDIPQSLANGDSPYMMFTFPVKPDWVERIIAGVHQSDNTARAQIVDKILYADLHEIISGFFDRTGIPVILNTSFNLHGSPIVNNAIDAIEVFLQSELDALMVDSWLITRFE